MIDDATGEIPYAKFFPSDTVFANMEVIRQFIEIKGLFTALYVDKASHFKTTRHGGLHYNVNPEQDETQAERALKELGITLISANSPQAKGRIEVAFRLFQDRLIKEMRLAGIKDYDEANKFLFDKFLPWRNKRYTLPAEVDICPCFMRSIWIPSSVRRLRELWPMIIPFPLMIRLFRYLPAKQGFLLLRLK